MAPTSRGPLFCLLYVPRDSSEETAELMRLAHRMCFTEDALAGQVKLTTRHLLNGRAIEVGPGAP
jgi:hypothetical protein